MKNKKLFTTSEYISALRLQCDGNLYQCDGKDFIFFSNAAAAEYDAQWIVDFHKREGKRIKKPTIYKVKLEVHK